MILKRRGLLEVWVHLFFSSLCPSPWLGEDRRLSPCSPLDSEGDPNAPHPPTLAQVLDISLKVSTSWCGSGFLPFSFLTRFFRLTGHHHTHTARLVVFVVALLLLVFTAACFVFWCVTAASTASSDSSEVLSREFCRSPLLLANFYWCVCRAFLDVALLFRGSGHFSAV